MLRTAVKLTLGQARRSGVGGVAQRCALTTASGEDDGDSATTPKPKEAPQPSARGEQARGAMRDFLRSSGGNASNQPSLWERLKKDVGSSGVSKDGPPQSDMRVGSPSSPSSQGVKTSRPRPPHRGPQQAQQPQRDQQEQRSQQQQPPPQQRPQMDAVSTVDTSSAEVSREFNSRKYSKQGRSKGLSKKGKTGGSTEGGEDAARVYGGGGGEASIPPAIRALLFDHEHFEREARKGYVMDTADMDAGDAFLAECYMESYKSSTHEYRAVMESPSLRRTIIPQARPMSHLVGSMTPNIYAAPVGSRGYALGAGAWEVVSKNTCYSDADRDFISNGIAREAEKVIAKAAKTASARKGPPDLVFQAGFRKGLPGIEDEKRRKSMEETKPVDDYSQAETDWSTQAVVDEDELR